MTHDEVELFLREAFEENFELLRLEAGYSVTPDVKEAAFQQVLLYWRKLNGLAMSVTDTEVKLSLPQQITPEGRTYSIEGVVDIVREDQITWMYDIKTHNADDVRATLDQYEQQLNIYAHIWQSLRGQSLDGTAVIATAPTQSMRTAMRSGQDAKIAEAFEVWEPVVPIPLNNDKVAQTVNDFGQVVDRIQNREFKSASLEKLKAPIGPHKRIPFGTEVCRNCDARFSCDSYRQFALANVSRTDATIRMFLEDFGDDITRADWIDGNLDSVPPTII